MKKILYCLSCVLGVTSGRTIWPSVRYHHPSNLGQCPFIISKVLQETSGHRVAGVSVQHLRRLKLRCQPRYILIGAQGLPPVSFKLLAEVNFCQL